MFVSGILLAAGIRGPRFDRSEEFWGGALFAAIGLLCAAWGYAQIRARWPIGLGRRLRGVTLAVDRDEARRGEQVSVRLTLATSPGRDGEELEVGIVCTERWDYQVQARPRGAPVVLRQTAEATPHQEWRAVERRRGEHVVTFEIPQDAPFSYEGECVSFAWRVSARLVRRLRSDPRLDHPIWVRA